MIMPTKKRRYHSSHKGRYTSLFVEDDDCHPRAKDILFPFSRDDLYNWLKYRKKSTKLNGLYLHQIEPKS